MPKNFAETSLEAPVGVDGALDAGIEGAVFGAGLGCFVVTAGFGCFVDSGVALESAGSGGEGVEASGSRRRGVGAGGDGSVSGEGAG